MELIIQFNTKKVLMLLKQIQKLQRSNSYCIQRTKLNKIEASEIEFSSQKDKVQRLIQNKYKFSKPKNVRVRKATQPVNNFMPTDKFPKIQQMTNVNNFKGNKPAFDFSPLGYSTENRYRRNDKQYRNCFNRINLRTTYRGFNTKWSSFNCNQNINPEQQKKEIIAAPQMLKQSIKNRQTNTIINFILKKGIGRVKNKLTEQENAMRAQTLYGNLSKTKINQEIRQDRQNSKTIKQKCKKSQQFQNGGKVLQIQPW